MPGRSPVTLAVPLLPGAAKLPCIPQVPPMGCGHWARWALPDSSPSPTAQRRDELVGLSLGLTGPDIQEPWMQMSLAGPLQEETHISHYLSQNKQLEWHKFGRHRKTATLFFFGCQGLFPAVGPSVCWRSPAARGQISLRWGAKALAALGTGDIRAALLSLLAQGDVSPAAGREGG